MEIKDHYQVLELAPSATLPEIKQAYRRLAQLYHPDKNNNDPYATARFSDIKEAYEVLTNPSRKEIYLQQRWYQQSTGLKRTQDTLTPVALLKQSLELERYVSKLDIFRMDKQGLSDYIMEMISTDNIEKVNAFGETGINDQVCITTLECLNPLAIPQVKEIAIQLKKINTGPAVQEKINEYMSGRLAKEKRESYNIWIVLAVVIATCLLIYFLG